MSQMWSPFAGTNNESVEEVVAKWLQFHNEGTFTPRNLREYWRTTVPPIYAPQPNVSPFQNELEEQSVKMFLTPLDAFIAGESTPEQVYSSIHELDDAPALCGRVFNNGEPTYGCRDCGYDPTCVLCSDCFKASAHTKHRYKMSTSSGGGYCDCGDIEAWRHDAFCSVHAKGKQDGLTCSHQQLPQDLVSRLHVIIDGILEYAMQILTQSESGFNLPTDLELPDAEPTREPSLYQLRDTFCAVLYNDEQHTFEEVINALSRSINCSKKEAAVFATYIDREGRSVVKCNGMQQCQAVKTSMDRYALTTNIRPFNIKIFRAYVLAHQLFASTLLVWLDKLLEKGNAIKSIFAEVLFSTPLGDTMSRLERIMWFNNDLCKASRVQWHKLLISGLLMDIEIKKKFARLFTKHYGKMMKTFVYDDHEHSVCTVSLGVQLFTMPTIAHMLIAEEEVIFKLLHAFVTACHTRIKSGKLLPLSLNANPASLEPNSMTPLEFKRVQYILFDLKYLLGMVPSVWTDQLRKGFLHGFKKVIELFNLMQHMDPITRKEGSHVEFEQEWEGAFNLQIKLAPIITELVNWAASDRVVIIKSVRMLLKAICEHGCDGLQKRFIREAAGHTLSCIDYDVSRSPVSMHAPLTRLCAFILVQLGRHSLSYDSSEFPAKNKPAVQELMEPALRTIVMVAQCTAGMWRRNGMSLSSQTYFYRNVRCRQEMFDRDVLMLQCGAALMDPDHFVITLLNRFNLMSWQRPDYETTCAWGHGDDNIRQTVVVLEEFLQTIIYVLQERYTTGVADVTAEDCTMHEVIHLLCINNMAHSTINKLLPEGTDHETGMEQIIDEIAEFKKSSEDAKGYYQLKSKFFNRYNVFFYHYSKEEQSKSEVRQRERCKREGADANSCCPPPLPPPFTSDFSNIITLLNCDVLRHVLTQVICRWCDPRSPSVTETAALACLHLIGLACLEDERTPGFLEAPDQLLHLLGQLQRTTRPSQLQEMVLWCRERLCAVIQSREGDPSSRGSEDGAAAPTAGTSTARDAAGEDQSVGSGGQNEKQRRTDQAQARKQMILNKMAAMQKSFMKKHKALFMEESDNTQDRSEDGSTTDEQQEGPQQDKPPQQEAMEVDLLPEERVAVGPAQTLPKNVVKHQTCIVCHIDENLTPSAPSRGGAAPRLLVVGVMIQPSTVLTRRRRAFVPDTQPMYLPADLHRGIHVSSCGHPMHVSCWRMYYEVVAKREQRRMHSERGEFTCPLCKSLCNSAVPLLPCPTQPVIAGEVDRDYGEGLTPFTWLQGLHSVFDAKTARSLPSSTGRDDDDSDDERTAVAGLWLPPPLSAIVKTWGTRKTQAFSQIFTSSYNTSHTPPLRDADEVAWELAQAICTVGLAEDSANSGKHGRRLSPPSPQAARKDERIMATVLVSLAYTLRCCEEVQRFENRALLKGVGERQHLFLSALTATTTLCPSLVTDKQSGQVCRSGVLSALSDVMGLGSTSVLEVDAFSALVTLVNTLPALFEDCTATPKGGLQDQYVLKLCFLLHIVQLLLTYDTADLPVPPDTSSAPTTSAAGDTAESSSGPVCPPADVLDSDVTPDDDTLSDMEEDDNPPPKDSSSIDMEDSADEALTVLAEAMDEEERKEQLSRTSSEADGVWLQEVLARCREAAGLPPLHVETEALLSYVKEKCLPFLRCCGLFFHLLTGSEAPEELRSSVWVPESEYYCLLRYLGLGTSLRASLIDFKGLTARWLLHPRLRTCLRESSFDGHRVLAVNQLTCLTRDYSELISDVTGFRCPSSSSGEKSSTPTICLVCGTIMCSQSYCCQAEMRGVPSQMVGPTAQHALSCSGGVCAFLRVWDCRVVLRTCRIDGCYTSPPYLDQYGETDIGLRRGNPLFLNAEHYSRLHLMWLQHQIPETVSRVWGSSTQQNSFTDWQHL